MRGGSIAGPCEGGLLPVGAKMVYELPWEGASEEAEEQQDLSGQARLMGAVGQAAAALGTSMQAREILDRVVDYARLLFQVPAAQVLVPLEPGRTYWVHSGTGAKELGVAATIISQFSFDSPVPLFIPDLEALASVPYFQHLVEQGFHSSLSMALRTDDSLQGLLLLASREPFHLRGVDLEALKLFGTHAASALRNAQRHDIESRTAEVLREALLSFPAAIPGVRFSHRYYSASAAFDVGGDFYDIGVLPDGRVSFLVGDVMGKGLRAAARSGLAKIAAQAYAYLDPKPSSVLVNLNGFLSSSETDRGLVTAAYCLLDRASGALDCAPPVTLPS